MRRRIKEKNVAYKNVKKHFYCILINTKVIRYIDLTKKEKNEQTLKILESIYF